MLATMHMGVCARKALHGDDGQVFFWFFFWFHRNRGGIVCGNGPSPTDRIGQNTAKWCAGSSPQAVDHVDIPLPHSTVS